MTFGPARRSEQGVNAERDRILERATAHIERGELDAARAELESLEFGVVDAPDGHLKNHATPIPYLGGLAVFTSFLL